MRRKSGFTMIELLFVLAIIGILGAIAIPQYTQYTRKAKLNEAFTNLADWRTRLEQYYQDNRTYVSQTTANTIGFPSTYLTNVAAAKYFSYTASDPVANDGYQTYFLLTASSIVAGTDSSLGANTYIYTIDSNDVRQTLNFGSTTALGTALQCWSINGTSC